MKKYALGLLIGFGALVLVAVFFQRHALACELLPVLDYQNVEDEIYAAPGRSMDQVETLRELLASASDRISSVYGTPTSRPRMLIARDSQMAARWGANETASMHRMPWRSCIVIGPEGRNVDVIAHEWLHAEIQDRVGFWRFLREIPVWFDEGAALTLDYRAPFLPENIDLSDAQILAGKELGTARKFFSGNIRQNYQAARLAVDPMIHADRFYDDLDRVSRGESFEDVFLTVNRSIPSAAVGSEQ